MKKLIHFWHRFLKIIQRW